MIAQKVVQKFFRQVWGNLGKILRTPTNLPASRPMGSLIPILVLFTSKIQVWTFWYILLLCELPLFRTILDD